jgi:putative flavoprotein involved in K+ transport
MTTLDTVVVGAGHAGLAVSRLLTDAGRDHVVLDRGRVGERWRTERWDSLHLLTPSWMTRLPGWSYAGPDPDGYLGAGELVGLLEEYAASFGAPVVEGATVLAIEAIGDDPRRRYRVVTSLGTWQARHVVVATGPHGTPYLPEGLAGLRGVDVITSSHYRNPDRLGSGGVLVVGASSSGLQIADELQRAGRDVTLAVGRHTRMPRRYRGMDIFWWLEATGRLARTIAEVSDPEAARRGTSLQLVGRGDPTRATQDLDLGVLQARGVRLVGRLGSATGRRARFRSDLAASVAAADEAMARLLDSIDVFVDRVGLAREVWETPRPRPIAVPAVPEHLDLRAEGIGTVLVAAGYRPERPWLGLPTHADGSLRQHRGVTSAEGFYVVGQRFQHRRDSSYIDGARHDAHDVVTHLLSHAHAHAGTGSRCQESAA